MCLFSGIIPATVLMLFCAMFSGITPATVLMLFCAMFSGITPATVLMLFCAMFSGITPATVLMLFCAMFSGITPATVLMLFCAMFSGITPATVLMLGCAMHLDFSHSHKSVWNARKINANGSLLPEYPVPRTQPSTSREESKEKNYVIVYSSSTIQLLSVITWAFT